MAAFSASVIKACTNGLPGTLFRDTSLMPKILANATFVRHGRRTCRPPAWFTPKKIKKADTQPNLTKENKAFLQELYEDSATHLKGSPLKDGPWERNQWDFRTIRSGVLGVKIGVIPQWDKEGNKFFTTLIQVLDNHVITYTPPDEFMESKSYKDKWRKRMGSVLVGALSTDPFKYTPQYVNKFKDAGVPPKRKLARFLVTENAAIQPGTPLGATHFRVGDYVDVQAKTIGHGFQGVVKRWGMKGGPASHGTTKWHRRVGNIGGGRDTAKVWKGKKMPGHMGMEWRCLRGLKIWRINTKYNVLYVHGPCLPGPNHCYIRVMDTKLPLRKLELMENPPYMPTFCPDEDGADMAEDICDADLFQFSEPSIQFSEDKGK